MLATIELPNNQTELAFILEVLKRLNIQVIYNKGDSPLAQDVLEEHAAILRERRQAMADPNAQFFMPKATPVQKTKKQRTFGAMKGLVLYMAPDFDAPLDDFKDYM